MIQESTWILYQFQFSHYCEKARWVLQLKNAAFQQINIAPGLHKIIIHCKAPSVQSPITVPILIAGDQVIQGSGQIIDYLDRVIPEKPLGFDQEDLQKECAALEYLLNETIATSLRSIAYTIFLKHRKFLISFWSLDGPWYCKTWLTIALPYLERVIERLYKADSDHLAEHENRFNAGLDHLDKLCESQPFLVGNRFSRCDLTMASLLAPLNFPKQHPYPNPLPLPDEFQRFCEIHRQRPVLGRVAEIYREYRPI
ncbi:MAG: glutathione S-transferase family protein, partial [Methylococcales bacterium]